MTHSVENVLVEAKYTYFKPGDDLRHFLDRTTTPSEAFVQHAAFLREVASYFDAVGAFLTNVPAKVIADTHYIGFTLAAEEANRMIETGLGDRDPFMEDEGEMEIQKRRRA